ncbi:glycine--tRNA ligase subunit beta [Microbulbifer flavimaris]|uniref:Glycine--tRNA ligase beta subunit n=1 Tax=Microbulbifer flavimaris TaxID=1781068 RepID=A0ABX4HYR3_9GAMM|nr:MULTISPECIES: glycine--tRNA ligase subunit beta [Microbulbifer]KUJ83086.1 glycine--tRNA ligase subunit beta [Microbulbifer sp. ZGT114]PCO05272.1 glycine--tRNA ligase subunit beta [Microbulbifer flavimaris]
MAQDFLVELGTEELPPKALHTLMEAFAEGIASGLQAAELEYGSLKAYAAPRRLAVAVSGLAEKQQDKQIEKLGPAVKAAFDKDGKATKAAEGFARSNGVTVEELSRKDTDKGERLAFVSEQQGAETETLLPGIVEKSLAHLPIPKRMRWGARREEFVRPVHWLLMLFGNRVVDGEVLGLKAGNTTRGHRFHCNRELEIHSAQDYVQQLREPGYVVADFAERREMIRDQVTAEAHNVNGEAVIDEDLLDEVTALVEWPVALTGRFEERFLEVPAEALISSMKEHQKYFHVVDGDGQLLPFFITVANIESQDAAQVIHGNERVIRPRLSDAAFFFETDKKTSLEARREKLKQVIFQQKLGTVYDKTERLARLAPAIARLIGANETEAERAASLCKSDLVTEMVFEFADMQGIAGYYYAENDGEPLDVARAMYEQYMPKFAGDELPKSDIGTVTALADRLDTLVGIFGIGQPPSGSRDPFALRRASLGIIRLLVEKNLDLDLRQLLELARDQFPRTALGEYNTVVDQTLAYVLERFRARYEDQGVPAEVFMAVAARKLSQPLDIDNRVQAVYAFSQLAEAQALAAANKRVSNILAKLEGPVPSKVDEGLLQEDAEKALYAAVEDARAQVAPIYAERRYTEGLAGLAGMRETVDNFFDHVMVMTDDEALRNNRLALLAQLRALFLEVADISLLAPAK